MKVFALGYADPAAEQKLVTWMEDLSTVLVDIRFRPVSRWHPEWNKRRLQERWGARYLTIQALGNINYNQPDMPIKIQDPDKGIAELVRLMQAGYQPIVLCACKHYATCHRHTVIELLQAQCPEIEVIQ
ncbi:DUF488 family protein [Tengunoibacter tsumagoiensis]|uniref:DUF488 domain-containing protein n=1 Tax=Tengunoibacter tsumagoiensis TaxID=2014871 RepID=A0A402A809_9CHLR|nr:DUF488 family protein [Tengunoibacter tsumagoiensis]GCE15310.1 hypothetical protein KTT_51690 [Tengunoibacter tsumagoiensis]